MPDYDVSKRDTIADATFALGIFLTGGILIFLCRKKVSNSFHGLSERTNSLDLPVHRRGSNPPLIVDKLSIEWSQRADGCTLNLYATYVMPSGVRTPSPCVGYYQPYMGSE